MVARVDIHLVLLGGDIRALIRLEWLTARMAGSLPVLFLKQGIPRTPAAQSFRRHVEGQVHWQRSKDLAHLRCQVQTLLVEHRIGWSDYYEISSVEIE